MAYSSTMYLGPIPNIPMILKCKMEVKRITNCSHVGTQDKHVLMYETEGYKTCSNHGTVVRPLYPRHTLDGSRQD